jgi:hypothetical protein
MKTIKIPIPPETLEALETLLDGRKLRLSSADLPRFIEFGVDHQTLRLSVRYLYSVANDEAVERVETGRFRFDVGKFSERLMGFEFACRDLVDEVLHAGRDRAGLQEIVAREIRDFITALEDAAQRTGTKLNRRAARRGAEATQSDWGDVVDHIAM